MKGGRTSPLADFTDLFPTICDLAAALAPSSPKIDGQSLAPFLLGKAPAPRKWIFNHYGDERVVRDERFKLKNNGDLFDLDADPAEQQALPKDAELAVRVKLQAVLDSMPESTPLPFPHRSLSAFKKRAEAAKQRTGEAK